MNAISFPEAIVAGGGASAFSTVSLSGKVESRWPFTSAVSAGMVNSPACRADTEKVTATVELIAPLTMLKFWEFPICVICKPGTLGVGTFFGCAPSKESESVAVSPREIVSRSSDAVKLAARAHGEIKPSAARKKNPAITNMCRFILLKCNSEINCSIFYFPSNYSIQPI
jgi:hypothetical protein